MKKILGLILVIFSLMTVQPVMAVGPMLKFSPSTGSYTNGETFTVTIGVNSGTEKSQAVDSWATFDAAKLEVVSIETVTSPAFAFSLDKDFNNTTGKFHANCISTDMSTFNATVLNGDLVTVTFRAKATGTANVNFTCVAGSTVDSGIYDMSATANDVIDCPSNINGVYTINEGSAPSNPNPTAVPTAVPTTGTELPKTGTVETTIGLLIFGFVSLLSSLALKFL